MRIPHFVAAVLLLLASALPSAARADDVETLECDSSAGWRLTDFRSENPPANFAMGTVEDSIAVQYERSTLGGLLNADVLLTDMKELQLTMQSSTAIDAYVFVRDMDGASFLAPIKLGANSWETIKVKPGDFKLSQGSGVKKDSLDVARLGVGFGVLDAAPVAGGGQGANLLRIRTVGVVLGKLDITRGELIVEKNEAFTRNRTHHGSIIVRGGATLKISAPRAVIHGDIIVEDGKLDFGDGVLAFPQHYRHHRRIGLAGGKSSCKLRGTTLVTPGALLMDLRDGASFSASQTAFVGGITCFVGTGCEVTLETVTTPGEFIVRHGATFSATSADGLTLGLELGKGFGSGDSLTFPSGADVASWKCSFGLDVKLRTCTNVKWAALGGAGAGGTVEQSALDGAGGVFDGSATYRLDDFRNGRALGRYTMTLADRILRFKDCNETNWGLTVHDEASVVLTDCAIASLNTFDSSRVLVDKSVCGNVATIGANGHSIIRITGSRVTGLVVARDHAKIVFERCEIAGQVNATGNATIEIRRCTLNSRVTCTEGARLIIEPAAR